MAPLRAWTISDPLWEKVEIFIPTRKLAKDRTYLRCSGGAASPRTPRRLQKVFVKLWRRALRNSDELDGIVWA
jgi:hypothetical protein